MKQNIFFIEPTDCTFSTPSKIGNLLMNRLVVDEDASFEILKILEFSKEDSKSNFHSLFARKISNHACIPLFCVSFLFNYYKTGINTEHHASNKSQNINIIFSQNLNSNKQKFQRKIGKWRRYLR